MIKITWNNNHVPFRSISTIEDIEIPTFTVITGLNGSGKTHFLELLNSGQITPDIKQEDIIYISNQALDLTNLRGSYSIGLENKKDYLYNALIKLKNRYVQIRLERNILTTTFTEDEFLNIFTPPSTDFKFFVENRDFYNDQEVFLLNSFKERLCQCLGEGELAPESFLITEKLIQLALDKNKSIFNLSRQDIDDISIYDRDFTSFCTQIFVTYYLKRKKLQESMGKKVYESIGRAAVCENQVEKESIEKKSHFLTSHGDPPWELINNWLLSLESDLEILPLDELASTEEYTPKILKKGQECSLHVRDLSSGEKLVFSIFISLYFYKDKNSIFQTPKLILLDEVDAHLHPVWTKKVLMFLKEQLVDSLGISVVLATHSPTTVALSENECIFEKVPTGLRKISKQHALDLLTEGVPTLAIDTSNKKIVLVEATQDANIYNTLYKSLKQSEFIDKEKAHLDFISVSTNVGNQTLSGGCTVVEDWVKNKVQNLPNFYGLIDWDGKNKPHQKLFVLCENRRYSIENLILDPLLIGLSIYHAHRTEFKKLFTDHTYDFNDINPITQPQFQDLIDRVETIVNLDSSSKVPFSYVGYNDIVFLVNSNFLKKRGHDLEDKILSTFPFLKQHRKGMLRWIVEDILSHYPKFIPTDFCEICQQILEST